MIYFRLPFHYNFIDHALISSLEQIKATYDGTVRQAAHILINNISKRLPLTREVIAAAILDPSIQHLQAVQTWLSKNKRTRAQVLNDVIRDYSINMVFEATTGIDETVHMHQDSQCARMALLRKHSILTKKRQSIDAELEKFINILEEEPDVLAFWRKEQSKYPLMAQIAKVILAKPATSAKSESAFSTAGAVITKRRANIDPLRAEKVLFIHDNFKLLDCDSEVADL